MSIELIQLVDNTMGNNVYLINDQQADFCVVVDPSFDEEQILSHLKKNAWTLGQVWLSHGHYDHFWSTGELMRKAGGKPQLVMGAAAAAQVKAQSGLMLGGSAVPDIPVADVLLQGGETFRLGGQGARVEVFDVSGHAPGSMLFYLPEHHLALTGDAIFREGIGRFDLPGSDGELLFSNLREKVLTLPEDTTLYCGHGPKTTAGWERDHNPFLR